MLFIGVLFLLVSAQAILAQDAKVETPEVTTVFRSGVSNVRADVQVIDRGKIVADLAKEDFLLWEQDRPQPVLYAGRDAEPISLLLLLDVSGSTRKHIEQMAAVARDALRFLRPQDRVAIMVFSKASLLRSDFTENRSDTARGIRESVWEESLGSGTEINASLLAAANHFEIANPDGRRAILMLTDNLALHYKNPDEPVISALDRTNVVLNAMVVGNARRPDPDRTGRYTNPDFTVADVFKISEASGGEAMKAERTGAAFALMVERIRARYSLHYKMPAGPEGFRRIRVELSPAAKVRYPQATVQARRGYYAK